MIDPLDHRTWRIWDPEKAPLPDKPSRLRRISLCTTCMNRLEDLRVTLPKNIADNADYPNVEFVLLDWNSSDDLQQWVRDTMMEHINSGRLVYYRYNEPQYFEMGRSRNVAFKLASGEIVNNVDADNFTKEGFASYINLMAEIAPRKALFAKGKRLPHGRIGFYKDEFIALGGYDEDLVGYGHDDHDLICRAMGMGFILMWWGGRFIDRIKTPRNLKTANFPPHLRDYEATTRRNKELSIRKLRNRQFVANTHRHWGRATVIKNFKDTIIV